MILTAKARVRCSHRTPTGIPTSSRGEVPCWATAEYPMDAAGRSVAELTDEAAAHFRKLGWKCDSPGGGNLCPEHAKART